MRYLCTIYYDEEVLDALRPEEHDALVREALAYDEELERSGHLVAGGVLGPPASAATVRVQRGGISATGGPGAGRREELRQFHLIEARDLNEAIQVAAKLPPGRLGCIEVRPVRGGGERTR